MPTVPISHPLHQGSLFRKAQMTSARSVKWQNSADGQLAAVPESQAALPTGKMWTPPVDAGAAKSQPLMDDGERKLR